MDWSDITGLLGKAAPLVGTLIAGPAGGAVGGLIASALGVEAKPDAVAAAVTADPQALERIRALEIEQATELRRLAVAAESNRLEAETRQHAEVNATMRAESASADAYVRRWRPTFGYAVALAWVLVMGAVAWAIVMAPEQAGAIIAALTSTSVLWSVALAVLGISVVQRSKDKQTAAGGAPAGLGNAVRSLLRSGSRGVD